ncbi:hypothetical protein [Musicola keenii]|uniref:hypothetical protein n=1 Tax=Musicola keenii TaxID=2884250 RepID=UPI001785597A|nr:hypothetical protein [Musicola keenii]
MFPFNAWLRTQMDNYHHKLRDASVDFYMAELAMDREICDIGQLRNYYLTGMKMAELSQQSGDEGRYLFSLIKMHHCLIAAINDTHRCHLFRVQSYYFARQTLQMICNQFSVLGCWEKVSAFQQDFVQRVVFMP